MQYTVRQIPKHVDKIARAKAKAEGKSLNETIVEAIKAGLGVPDDQRKKRDLSDLVGSMSKGDAQAIDDAVKWMDDADVKSQREGDK